MSEQYRKARHVAMRLVVVLAVLAPFAPADPYEAYAAPSDCSLAADVRATTCRLVDGQTVERSLGGPGNSATYRIDTVAPNAVIELAFDARNGGPRIAVFDWRGTILGEGTRTDAAPEVRLRVPAPLPGVYGVRIDGDISLGSPGFRLSTSVTYPSPAARAVWPRSFEDGEAPLTGERQIVRTPRGGTPAGGVAVARALGAPPDGEVGDFMLVADVQFEQIVGASAFTVRFRYEPEAGGGTGYLFSLDPFGGTASLDSFEEGQRRSVVDHTPLPFMPTSDGPNRLVVHAEGPAIRVTLDGQPVLEATDGRYRRGLIAVGAVTWSDPVAVTFDHIQVTTPR